MVTVFLIALLAAVASPAFVGVMRDTEFSRMNMQVAEIYRKAYIDSAQQATILVRWTGGDPPFPTIDLVRATLDSATPTLVSPRRCNAIDWTNPNHVTQTIFLRPKGDPHTSTMGFLNSAGAEVPVADICYSQRRAFVRYDNGAFTELPGPARVYVKNTQTNLIRRVFIPTFGLPRLIQ